MSRQPTSMSQQQRNVERKVITQNYSYNPLVDPPGYGGGGNTQTMSQPTQQYTQQPQQYGLQDYRQQQYQPADRNYFEQNLLQINDQMTNVNAYNQQAVNHNQMLLEMQENKINSLMNEVKKMKDGGGGGPGGGARGLGLDKDKDLENLMMLNAFDDSLANTRLYYGDKLFNHYGRNGKMAVGDSLFSRNQINNNNNSNRLSQQQPLNQNINNNVNQFSFNPEQRYKQQVFGGFGDLYWDGQQNKNYNPSQQFSFGNNNGYNIPQPQPQQYQSFDQRIQTPKFYYPSSQQQIPQPQPQQSVFLRNSSQILNQPQQQQQIQYLPRTPQPQHQSYNIPSGQRQTPLQQQFQKQPIDDPLTNILIKQGQMMESLSMNIEKETKKQEKADLKKLQKRIEQNEEKQKLMLLQDEYQELMKPKNNIKNNHAASMHDLRFNNNPFDPQNIFQQNNNNLMHPMTMPLQLLIALSGQNNQNGQSKQSRIETIKMNMLMKKLAMENEILRNGKGGGKKETRHKSRSKKSKSKKSKKKNRQNDDDDDDEEEEYYDDEDDYSDDYDSDEYYDDDDDEDEDDEEQLPPPPPQETEEEKKKREEEELKKQKEARRLQLIKRLRLVKTRAMFPIMYFNTIKYQIQEKKAMAYKRMNEDLSNLLDFTTQWVQKVCSRGLNLISDAKASLDITKKLSEKEMRKRVDNLKLRVKALLDGLADNCKEEDIGNVAVQIFGQLTNNFNFPPQQFLYKFELNRLKFTQFGALNEMNGRQQLMLLLVFIIVRVLILRILFKPWMYSEKIKDSPDLRLNLKVVQSVIYEILIEYLRNSCPPIPNNQAMLSSEKKIKEIPKIPAATNDPVDPLVYKDAQKNDEPVVIGLFQRNQLEGIFEGVENATWLETMKSTLQGLGESLVQTVNKKYDEMRAIQIAENKANKQNISSLLSKNMQDKEFLKKLKEKEKEDQ